MEDLTQQPKNPFSFENGQEGLLKDRFNAIFEPRKGETFSRFGGITIPAGIDDVWNISRNYRFGSEAINNTPLSLQQFLFALTLTKDDYVQLLIDNPGENFDFKKLLKKRLFDGMKVLDIGCGLNPMFARVMRGLGANVYTSDLIPASDFDIGVYDLKGERLVCRKTEIDHHIQGNIIEDVEGVEGSSTVTKIIEHSGGEFDFVTDAHLNTAGGYISESQIETLLKKGGVYLESDVDLEIYIK